MFASDSDSERATSIEDYQYTCSQFIIDISKDYKDWIDRYQLSDGETKTRKDGIDFIVKSTNDWITKFGNTIKKIDIIMNDGINKMAETTAGYPFKIDITSANQNRYIIHQKKPIKLNLKSRIMYSYWDPATKLKLTTVTKVLNRLICWMNSSS
jgi:hypothetical protein